ncbi:MAG: hypothetical protein F4X98_07805 [Gammaproteobacteria bacterium]|nr:hypothetical protein [Gammaproteobacteria bacterium]
MAATRSRTHVHPRTDNDAADERSARLLQRIDVGFQPVQMHANARRFGLDRVWFGFDRVVVVPDVRELQEERQPEEGWRRDPGDVLAQSHGTDEP